MSLTVVLNKQYITFANEGNFQNLNYQVCLHICLHIVKQKSSPCLLVKKSRMLQVIILHN